MPEVLPSQAVAIIDSLFPEAAKPPGVFVIGHFRSNDVAVVADLARAIAPDLIRLPSEEFARFFAAITACRQQVKRWRATERPISFNLGDEAPNPVSVIRAALARCPDAIVSAGTAELAFVDPPDLRESLRLDVGAAASALHNREWKAATVLAGATIEGLLLWKLGPCDPASLQAALGNEAKKPPPLDDWNMNLLIQAARGLNYIQPSTERAALLAKDFRNLIHPGRGKRLQQACDRGTALLALGALEHVIRDLTPPPASLPSRARCAIT